MLWHDAVTRLRQAREPGMLVTVAEVRGHGPRKAGAKMVVSASGSWGSIGGGDLEAAAIARARAKLAEPGGAAELVESELSDRVPHEHGGQCCGGVVTLLFDPLPVVPAVAIFGVGHVGWELARILARHDLELHLIDTRPEMLAKERLDVLADALAAVNVHRIPLLPETVIAELPPGAHVLIMTHDHAEDLALCDVALGRADLGSIGLIGSRGKWARFRRRLGQEAGHDVESFARIKTPIGLPGIRGSEPATIAVGVAADLLQTFQREVDVARAALAQSEGREDPANVGAATRR
ncbi:MAG: xanthine dehydrogenase accessory protein XdhC [Acidobacteriota bacterium]|nr:xanthine dehydrogenase accessory protein XdhC [Acidobacteriota bacterium]